MKRAVGYLVLILAAGLFSVSILLCAAADELKHDTDWDNHKHSFDGACPFKIKATMWYKSDTGLITKIKYKIKNDSNNTCEFKIDQVRLLATSSGNEEKSWTIDMTVKKGETKEKEISCTGAGLKHNENKMQLRMKYGTPVQTWYLEWDPTIEGGASTTFIQSK